MTPLVIGRGTEPPQKPQVPEHEHWQRIAQRDFPLENTRLGWSDGGQSVARYWNSELPNSKFSFKYRHLNGGPGQNRTVDTVIFSHVLYQLSYRATVGKASGPLGAPPGPLASGRWVLP